MQAISLPAYRSRSELLDASAEERAEPACAPLSAGAVRALRYMQDIESHTVIYLRTLLGTRAVDDPQVSSFLAGWFYEETAHGLALARLLEANGTPVAPRERSSAWSLREGLTSAGAWLISQLRSDACAVHMCWGAINELTTLNGYRRLARLAGDPALSDLLGRLIRDESRHFGFYFEQARRRLASVPTQRLVRTLVGRFWAPVGSGVQPAREVRFLASYLFGGPEGRAAARKVDDTIRTLPGMERVPLLESWLEREASA